MCMECIGGTQIFCKGCMERCIIDPFHIKMHFLSFGSNKTNRQRKGLGALGEEKIFGGGGGGGGGVLELLGVKLPPLHWID